MSPHAHQDVEYHAPNLTIFPAPESQEENPLTRFPHCLWAVQADPTLGEQYQTNFPTKVLVDSQETFTDAIKAQHVVSKLKGGRRNEASFVETGFLLVDVDDGLPITAFEEEYKDFTYLLATSRHHQKETCLERSSICSSPIFP